VAVVDHQEVETDEDWAVEADHQRREDTQRMGVEDAAVVGTVGDIAVVAVAGDAVVGEDHGAVVGLVHKREAVDHLRWEVAVHESHLVVAADLLHLERAAGALPYVAVDRPVLIFPSVEVHLPEEAE
jgi:hypothetical protein